MDVGISAGRNLGGNGSGGLGRLGGGRFHLSRKLIIRQCDGRGEQHGGKAERICFMIEPSQIVVCTERRALPVPDRKSSLLSRLMEV